jgi:hypothetical protein
MGRLLSSRRGCCHGRDAWAPAPAEFPIYVKLILTLLVMEAFMKASKPMSPEPIFTELMTSEPMSSTPRVPKPRACQEQHHQHDDDSHPLLPGSHSLSLPCITMSGLYET